MFVNYFCTVDFMNVLWLIPFILDIFEVKMISRSVSVVVCAFQLFSLRKCVHHYLEEVIAKRSWLTYKSDNTL